MNHPDRRARIVFLASSLEGGTARVFLTLLRHLDRSRFEPHLLLLDSEGEFMRQVPYDVAVHVLAGSRPPRTLPRLCRLMGALIWLVWKIRPLAVLSTGGINLALLLARPLVPRRTRLVVRECSVLGARLVGDIRHQKTWRWLYRYLYRRADRVVCQSDSTLEELSN